MVRSDPRGCRRDRRGGLGRHLDRRTSKGLLLAGETGVLPKVLQRRNKAGVQEGILVLQAIIVTLLAAIFLLVHNVSAAFFTLVDMAAALYLIMYMFMFASAILLRRNKPDVHRSFRAPAMTTIAVIGFLASLAAFALGFVPPTGLAGISTSTYPYVMVAVIVILGAPALIFYKVKKPSWVTHKFDDQTEEAGPLHSASKATPS